jgi:hypothetical protein
MDDKKMEEEEKEVVDASYASLPLQTCTLAGFRCANCDSIHLVTLGCLANASRAVEVEANRRQRVVVVETRVLRTETHIPQALGEQPLSLNHCMTLIHEAETAARIQ